MAVSPFPSTTTDSRGNTHLLRRIRTDRSGRKTGHYATIITDKKGKKVHSTIIRFEGWQPRDHVSQPKAKEAKKRTFWLFDLFSRQNAAAY